MVYQTPIPRPSTTQSRIFNTLLPYPKHFARVPNTLLPYTKYPTLCSKHYTPVPQTRHPVVSQTLHSRVPNTLTLYLKHSAPVFQTLYSRDGKHFTPVSHTLYTFVPNTLLLCPKHFTPMSQTIYSPVPNTLHPIVSLCPKHSTPVSKTLYSHVPNTLLPYPKHPILSRCPKHPSHPTIIPGTTASHSPKTRRKRLSARMKSFSLDTPDPPKQLLGIDEMTKKKSSSFTNNCFGATPGQPNVNLPVQKKRFGFGTNRSTSLEIEESSKRRSRSSSPQCSPKSKKKEIDVYVSLYHFRGKEKDDMDLRPGSRVTVTNSSDPDWWKGKCNSRSGYFPAKYLLRLQKGQKVYQVTHTMNLTEIDGLGGMRLHKDQIVLCVDEPSENATVIHVKAANNREAMCPSQFLSEV